MDLRGGHFENCFENFDNVQKFVCSFTLAQGIKIWFSQLESWGVSESEYVFKVDFRMRKASLIRHSLNSKAEKGIEKSEKPGSKMK